MKVSLVTFLSILVAVVSSPAPQSHISDFVNGFCMTLNAKKEFNNLVVCLKEADQSYEDFVEAWHLFIKFTREDMNKALKMFEKAMKELKADIEDCKNGSVELQKIVDAIKKIKLLGLVGHVMQDFATFRSYFSELTIAIRIEDYLEVGRVIGQIVHKILFEYKYDSSQPEFILDWILEFTEGFLEGLGHNALFNNTEECIKGVASIYHECITLIGLLVNFKDPEYLLKIFNQVKTIIIIAYGKVGVCVAIPSELYYLFKRVKSINGSEIYARVIAHQLDLMRDIANLFKFLAEFLFKDSGRSLGDIPYLLIIKEAK